MKRKVNRKKETLKQRFGMQEGGNIVDPQGFLDSNSENFTPFKVIPSNNITMEGVSENIVAFPLSESGQVMGSKLMQPDENFTFPDASSVLEIPQSEFEKMMAGGEFPMFQSGGGVGIAGIQALELQAEEANKKLEEQAQQERDQFQTQFKADTLELATPKEENKEFVDSGNVDLFNPFGGFDIPTAAFKLGQGIESGDAEDIAFSGLKLGTGLARNFFSGLGQERRNQFVVDNFNEQQRENLTRTETLQEGGQLTELDVERINESSEFQFNLETASELFEKRQPVKAPEKQTANLGRYKDVGYFDVNSINGDTIVLDTTARNPHNASTVKNLVRPLEALNPGKKIVINYKPKKQEGGSLTEADLAAINQSSEFQFNMDTANDLFARREEVTAPPAVEAQLGRFKDVNYFDVLKTSDKEISLMATEKNPHNRDSIKQLIPELRRLNPGKKINIQFQDGGELEKVLTDGFVTGIDNPNFKEPNVEVEAGEHIDSQGEPVKEVIGDKHSQGGEDMQLEDGDRIISDHLKVGGQNAKTFRKMFDIKVKAGDTYATVLDKYKDKSGLTEILKEKEEIIKQIDKQKEIDDESTAGLNLQFLSKKLNELDEKQKPLEVEQKEVFNEVFTLQEASKPKEERAASEMEDEPVFQLGGTTFNSDQIIKMGSQFDISPEDSLSLFQVFKNGGKYMAQDGIEFGGTGSGLGFVPEGQSQNTDTGLFGGVDQAAFEETRLKNPWFDWRGFNPNNPQDVLRFQKKFNELSTDGQQIREDGKFGEQTQSVQLPFTQTRGIAPTGDLTIDAPLLTTPIPVPQTPAEEEVEQVEKEQVLVDRLDTILLPDQSPLPPDALQPHLKNQRRFDRVDPNLISPEQQIEEINRNKNQVIKEINKLPDSQRRAALASLNANTNNQISSAIQQTNRFNSQVKTQTDQINLQQSNAEENFLASDALDFERRQLTAVAKTQNDIRNFFNQLNRIQIGNFNTINDLNLLNDLNDDFQFTSRGVEKTTPNPVFTSDPALRRMLQREQILATTQSKKKGGTYKSKKRGRKKK